MTDAACPKCSEPVAPGSLFCSKCGQDVSAVMPAVDQTQAMPGVDDTLAMTAVGEAAPAPVRSTMRQALRDATLGEYEIMNELGRGGMATVFMAHDISLDRKVAIKVMAPHLLEGEGMAERFKLEARTAAQLSHPHIIPIYAVKETADTLFFVMKYIEGRALDDIIKKSGQLPIPMVRDILMKVGSSLGYAHRRDVVHRDIKPGNIMIDDEGTPIVTDFGIAKVAEATGLTMTGTTIGTPSYMSPEQCQAKEVTGASDQYSLGVVAFEMLTGKLPFEGDSAVATMYKHCHDPLPPLEDFRADCPPDLIETISRMLAKEPDQRWPTMESAIQRLGSGTTSSVDPVRDELIALARETGSEELLRKLSDPALAAATTGTGGAQRASGGTGSPVGAGGGRSKAMAAGIAVVALVGVGALAALQPWKATESGGEEPTAQVQDVDQGADDGSLAGSPADASGGPGDSGTPADGAPDDRLADAGAGDPPEEPAGADDGDDDTPAQPVPTQPSTPQWVVDVVTVSGAPASLEVGQDEVLSAAALDPRGRAVPASIIDGCQAHGWSRCGVQWQSSDQSVLRVDAAGRVTALAPGSATVTAIIGGVPGSADVAVSAVPVAEVRVAPTSLILEMGQEEALSASAIGRGGQLLADAVVQWVSTAPSTASVDATTGLVRALRPGEVSIEASAGGVSGVVPVEVRPNLETIVRVITERFSEAFGSGDVDSLQRVLPLRQQGSNRLRQMFRNASDLQADLTVSSIDERGDEGTALVDGYYRWVDRQAGAQEFPVALTFRFHRGLEGWRPIGMETRN